MEINDWYGLLGVPQNASDDDILNAYIQKKVATAGDVKLQTDLDVAVDVLIGREKRGQRDIDSAFKTCVRKLNDADNFDEARRARLYELKQYNEDVLSRQPQNTEALKSLITIYDLLGEERAPDVYFQKLIRSKDDLDKLWALRRLSLAEANNGNPNEAIKYLGIVCKEPDATADDIIGLARLHYAGAGNLNSAVIQLSEALSKTRDSLFKIKYIYETMRALDQAGGSGNIGLKNKLYGKLEEVLKGGGVKQAVYKTLLDCMNDALLRRDYASFERLSSIYEPIKSKDRELRKYYSFLKRLEGLYKSGKVHAAAEAMFSPYIKPDALAAESAIIRQTRQITGSLKSLKTDAPELFEKYPALGELQSALTRQSELFGEYARMEGDANISTKLKTLMLYVIIDKFFGLEGKASEAFAAACDNFLNDEPLELRVGRLTHIEKHYPRCYKLFSEALLNGKSTEELLDKGMIDASFKSIPPVNTSTDENTIEKPQYDSNAADEVFNNSEGNIEKVDVTEDKTKPRQKQSESDGMLIEPASPTEDKAHTSQSKTPQREAWQQTTSQNQTDAAKQDIDKPSKKRRKTSEADATGHADYELSQNRNDNTLENNTSKTQHTSKNESFEQEAKQDLTHNSALKQSLNDDESQVQENAKPTQVTSQEIIEPSQTDIDDEFSQTSDTTQNYGTNLTNENGNPHADADPPTPTSNILGKSESKNERKPKRQKQPRQKPAKKRRAMAVPADGASAHTDNKKRGKNDASAKPLILFALAILLLIGAVWGITAVNSNRINTVSQNLLSQQELEETEALAQKYSDETGVDINVEQYPEGTDEEANSTQLTSNEKFLTLRLTDGDVPGTINASMASDCFGDNEFKSFSDKAAQIFNDPDKTLKQKVDEFMSLAAGALNDAKLSLPKSNMRINYKSFNDKDQLQQGQTRVPYVVGLSEQQALAAISDAGLNAVIKEENGDVTGKIMRQKPWPNTVVDKGDDVTITVFVNPNAIAVPDLTNMTLEEAIAATESASFTLETSGDTSGIVVGQMPAPGSNLKSGSVITAVFGTNVRTLASQCLELKRGISDLNYNASDILAYFGAPDNTPVQSGEAEYNGVTYQQESGTTAAMFFGAPGALTFNLYVSPQSQKTEHITFEWRPDSQIDAAELMTQIENAGYTYDAKEEQSDGNMAFIYKSPFGSIRIVCANNATNTGATVQYVTIG